MKPADTGQKPRGPGEAAVCEILTEAKARVDPAEVARIVAEIAAEEVTAPLVDAETRCHMCHRVHDLLRSCPGPPALPRAGEPEEIVRGLHRQWERLGCTGPGCVDRCYEPRSAVLNDPAQWCNGCIILKAADSIASLTRAREAEQEIARRVDEGEPEEPMKMLQAQSDVVVGQLRALAQSFISVGRDGAKRRAGRTAGRYGRRAQVLDHAADVIEMLAAANKTLYADAETALEGWQQASVEGPDIEAERMATQIARSQLAEAEQAHACTKAEWKKMVTQLAEAQRTVASIAMMLGWGNIPPRETLERDINALKARAAQTAEVQAQTLTEVRQEVEALFVYPGRPVEFVSGAEDMRRGVLAVIAALAYPPAPSQGEEQTTKTEDLGSCSDSMPRNSADRNDERGAKSL